MSKVQEPDPVVGSVGVHRTSACLIEPILGATPKDPARESLQIVPKSDRPAVIVGSAPRQQRTRSVTTL
jgi:hypothetical protein